MTDGWAMTVRVTMHGNLRRFLPAGRQPAPVDVADEATVQQLLEALAADRDTWVVAVNGTIASRATPLAEGDAVECWEPVSGG